ncbi:unnamed protein product [Gulo gulo]|uniref:Uncharacterized protein n=1 Tax=Gulo gulo TaxID=48420 RepID=A0A9X9LT12_GULGU|nr:unnamed protein product [Gulo gulo]
MMQQEVKQKACSMIRTQNQIQKPSVLPYLLLWPSQCPHPMLQKQPQDRRLLCRRHHIIFAFR